MESPDNFKRRGSRKKTNPSPAFVPPYGMIPPPPSAAAMNYYMGGVGYPPIMNPYQMGMDPMMRSMFPTMPPMMPMPIGNTGYGGMRSGGLTSRLGGKGGKGKGSKGDGKG